MKKDAVQLFCRQLGYPEGLKSVAWPTDDTIPPKIRRGYFSCFGHERHILECDFESIGGGNCRNSPAVVCQEHVTGKFQDKV